MDRHVGLDLAERGHHPRRVASQVVEVAQGDLEAGEVQAQLRAQPDRAGELTCAAGDDHGQRAAETTDQRQVGVSQHEGADQLRAVLGQAGGVRRSRLVQRCVTGREDGGVVNQTGPRPVDGRVEWHPTNLGAMAHYRSVGEVPPKRHTQFRDADGRLYREELMGEEGFSSDSSLLYHRGVPSAIVGSEVWELPDQTRTPNHPLKPRHLQLHGLFAEGANADQVTDRRLVLGNNDVRISYVVTGVDPSPYYRNAIGDECVYVESGRGVVETVFGVVGYRAGDYVEIPRATTHRWWLAAPSQLNAIKAN